MNFSFFHFPDSHFALCLFETLTGDGCTTSYDDDNDTLCYDDFLYLFQGTGVSNDNDDDKLLLSATYQNGLPESAVIVLDI